jgi:hypothetical protein
MITIHEAARAADLDALRAILDEDSDRIEDRTDLGWTALHVLAAQGDGSSDRHAAAARLLIQRGADANARDLIGQTPLHLIAMNGSAASVRVARVLLENGADVGATTDQGWDWQFYWQHGTEVKELLLSHSKQQGTGSLIDELVSLAEDVNRTLTKYIRVHDDIFGASVWTSLRRAIPIPGIFQAIPYPQHAATLAQARAALDEARQNLSYRGRRIPPGTLPSQFAAELGEYSEALNDSVSRLHEICTRFANQAAGGAGPTWTQYQGKLQEYDRSRRHYVVLGERLNRTYKSLSREA